MWTLIQDFRFAIRMLGKNPGFTAVAVLSLALGIGANATLFSIVDGYFLRPLPVKDARQLVTITSQPNGSSSYADYQDICGQTTTFKGIVAIGKHGALLMTSDVAEEVRADWVSPNYFQVLGVSPLLGHTFEVDGSRKDPTAVISYGLWQRRFGGAADAVGKVARFNGRNVTIVGIAPQWFRGMQKGMTTDVWFPAVRWAWQEDLARNVRDYDLIGRLRPGVGLARARAEFATIARRLAASFPATDKGLSFELTSEAEQFPAVLKLSVMLMAVVGLVLAICCANVAGMALAKGEARRSELAVRKALGAGRGRLLRQLLTENLVLAVVGGGLGLLLTAWLISLQPALMPPMQFPVHFDIRVDGRVFAYTIFASLMAVVISGLFPALHASKADLVSALKGGEESLSRQRRGLIDRNLLVVGQIALSVVLLIGAGLLLKSLMLAAETHPGFDPRKNLLTVNLGPSSGYGQLVVTQFYTPVVERIQSLPGVKQVSYAMRIPLSDAGSGVQEKVTIPGVELPAGQDSLSLHYNAVGLGYFRTVGARILRGRAFTQEDEATHRPTVLINETMARDFWPDKDPIGQVVRVEHRGDFEIIGVVEDGRNVYIHEAAQPYAYFLYAQQTFSEGTLLVETTGDPRALVDGVKREIRAVDKDAVLFLVMTLKELMHSALWGDEMPTLLIGILALLGMFLATVGLYGVTAFVVSRRTHEIGIRMALGAQRNEILEFVLAGSAKLAAAGILIGLAAALAATRLMASYLYGVQPRDPVVFTLCSLAALLVALLAAYIPARRATKVDPIVALRYE